MSSHTETNASGNSRQTSSAPHWWCSWCQGAMNRIRLAKSRNTSKRQKSRRSLSNVKRLTLHSLFNFIKPLIVKEEFVELLEHLDQNDTNFDYNTGITTLSQSKRRGVEHKFLSFLPFLLFQKLVQFQITVDSSFDNVVAQTSTIRSGRVKTPLFELFLSFCNDDVIVCASVCVGLFVCVSNGTRDEMASSIPHTQWFVPRAVQCNHPLLPPLSLSPLSLSLISHSARLAPLSYRSLIFALCPVSLACYFSFFFHFLTRSSQVRSLVCVFSLTTDLSALRLELWLLVQTERKKEHRESALTLDDQIWPLIRERRGHI